MNGSTENRAHGASEKPSPKLVVMNLATANKMLPLIRAIVADVLASRESLARLVPEEEKLGQIRRKLSWPERCRRYAIQEEIVSTERSFQDAQAELTELGVMLVDLDDGQVGFPTIVNGRRAYFSWKHGEEAVHYWHYPEQMSRRAIPASWLREPNLNLAVKT